MQEHQLRVVPTNSRFRRRSGLTFCTKRSVQSVGGPHDWNKCATACVLTSSIQPKGDPMRKILLGGLLAAAMIMPASAADVMWRSSKLIGLNVYNDKNEKLGDISEVLVDKSGKVDGVVIGVGGFLGMGQHDIKVDMSKLKFIDEAARTASTTTTGSATKTDNRPATTTSATTTKNKWYPDHAVLSGATKDSLKNTPEFKFD